MIALVSRNNSWFTMSGRGRGGRRICRGEEAEEEAHRERRRTAPTSSIVKKVKPCPAMPTVQREPKQHMVVRVQNLGHYKSWQLWPDLKLLHLKTIIWLIFKFIALLCISPQLALELGMSTLAKKKDNWSQVFETTNVRHHMKTRKSIFL